MNKLLVLTALCLGCVIAPWAPAQTRGMKVYSAERAEIPTYDPDRFHALIVGINEYKYWTDLRSAAPDAEAMADVLRRHFGYRHVQVLLNENATRQNILSALDSHTKLGESDSLLIYYAGHGWMDETGNGFWVPSDAARNNKFEYISNSRIKGDFFRKYKVKHLLVVADSCFSGSLLRGRESPRKKNWKIPSGFRKPSRWVLTSGDLAPVADDDGGGHSPFATRMLQYMKYSEDPAFGIQDMYVYMRKNLSSEPICNPMSSPQHMPGGEFIFCRLDQPLGATISTRPRTTGSARSAPGIRQAPARTPRRTAPPPTVAPAPAKKTTGTLIIECADYAVAYVGEAKRRSVSKDKPLVMDGLAPGSHTIKVYSRRRKWERDVRVQAGQSTTVVVEFTEPTKPAATEETKPDTTTKTRRVRAL